MTDIKQEIKLLAMGLGDGDRSDHLLCPMCNGGSSHERSLLIWCNNGEITYKCYRVKCGLHGKLGDSGVRKKVARVAKQSYASLVVAPLPPLVIDYLQERFTFTRQELLLNGIKWEPEQERILLPINGLTEPNMGGELEGYLARAYPALQSHNSAIPKAVAHFRIDKPSCLMHPYGRLSDTLVLAEDFWSALRINRAVPACALSGTSLGDVALKTIIKAGVKHLVFVLDADARHKAMTLMLKYSLMFRSVRAVYLSGVDPKDMSEQDYQKLILEIQQ